MVVGLAEDGVEVLQPLHHTHRHLTPVSRLEYNTYKYGPFTDLLPGHDTGLE